MLGDRFAAKGVVQEAFWGLYRAWDRLARHFGTTRREVLALADWLRRWQVPAVVMEATGDNNLIVGWQPLMYMASDVCTGQPSRGKVQTAHSAMPGPLAKICARACGQRS